MEKQDLLTIRVMILDTSYPIKIRREEEEIYRKAAKQLNERILAYRKKFDRNLNDIDYVIMVAFELSLLSLRLEEERDNSPFISTIQALDNRLAEYLKNNQLDTKNEE
ncbi:MAG: cell division protein ZapA [Paludibacteraceae bacterium]|nr:cell division protein ZapA [Paludibacteraceae bacterium]NLK93275.1 cell division protein ZapA [Bacteroidales bacterium]MBP8627813.1 cell division protein ZapA [Paludibacteraceae bacterium]MBP8781512.1 cell division protein ZapA [Paludibacteraceae bacterium]MBP9648029.1 cell division protein ZapA [Paludibacteraceae bacterium]